MQRDRGQIGPGFFPQSDSSHAQLDAHIPGFVLLSPGLSYRVRKSTSTADASSPVTIDAIAVRFPDSWNTQQRRGNPTDLWGCLDLDGPALIESSSAERVAGSSRGFARVHHRSDPLGPARGVVLAACLGFMLWGLGLAGCAAYRSSVSLEGQLDDLGSVLLEDGVREDLLATVGVER